MGLASWRTQAAKNVSLMICFLGQLRVDMLTNVCKEGRCRLKITQRNHFSSSQSALELDFLVIIDKKY